ERDRLGERQDVGRRRLYQLGVAAVLVGAEIAVARAHRPLAEQAVFASAAREAREDDHALAARQTTDAGAGRLDRAGHLATVDVRQPFGWRKASVQQQHVDLVQGTRADAHEDFTEPGHRIAIVLVEDLLGAAVLAEERRLQNGTSVRSSRTRRALWSQRGSEPGSPTSTVTRMPRPIRRSSASFVASPPRSPSESDGEGSIRIRMSSSPSCRRKTIWNSSTSPCGRTSSSTRRG